MQAGPQAASSPDFRPAGRPWPFTPKQNMADATPLILVHPTPNLGTNEQPVRVSTSDVASAGELDNLVGSEGMMSMSSSLDGTSNSAYTTINLTVTRRMSQSHSAPDMVSGLWVRVSIIVVTVAYSSLLSTIVLFNFTPNGTSGATISLLVFALVLYVLAGSLYYVGTHRRSQYELPYAFTLQVFGHLVGWQCLAGEKHLMCALGRTSHFSVRGAALTVLGAAFVFGVPLMALLSVLRARSALGYAFDQAMLDIEVDAFGVSAGWAVNNLLVALLQDVAFAACARLPAGEGGSGEGSGDGSGEGSDPDRGGEPERHALPLGAVLGQLCWLLLLLGVAIRVQNAPSQCGVRDASTCAAWERAWQLATAWATLAFGQAFVEYVQSLCFGHVLANTSGLFTVACLLTICGWVWTRMAEERDARTPSAKRHAYLNFDACCASVCRAGGVDAWPPKPPPSASPGPVAYDQRDEPALTLRRRLQEARDWPPGTVGAFRAPCLGSPRACGAPFLIVYVPSQLPAGLPSHLYCTPGPVSPRFEWVGPVMTRSGVAWASNPASHRRTLLALRLVGLAMAIGYAWEAAIDHCLTQFEPERSFWSPVLLQAGFAAMCSAAFGGAFCYMGTPVPTG